MPKQKPHRSKQNYGTPNILVRAVELDYGENFYLDLAADASNTKAPLFFDEAKNSLIQPWHELPGMLWLNPPFENLKVWAAECEKEAALGARIIMLTPASVGSNWFAEYCHNKCFVTFIRPRIIFEGCKDPYPKDCMLTSYGFNSVGYDIWDWKEKALTGTDE